MREEPDYRERLFTNKTFYDRSLSKREVTNICIHIFIKQGKFFPLEASIIEIFNALHCVEELKVI